VHAPDPFAEDRPDFAVKAEQQGDDDAGDRRGVLLDQVGVTSPRKRLDVLDDDLPDHRLKLAHRRQREIRLKGPPVVLVVGRLHRQRDGSCRQAKRRDGDALRGGEEPVIVRRTDDVRVPGEGPEAAVAGAVHDRALLARRGKHAVEVLRGAGIRVVEVVTRPVDAIALAALLIRHCQFLPAAERAPRTSRPGSAPVGLPSR
jgi:hypothetical protein